MKSIHLNTLSTGALVEKYKSSSAVHGRAREAGQVKKANREYDLLVEIRRELRARGAAVHQQLLELLQEPELGTRYWAAIMALEFAPFEGERVLKEIASIPKSPTGFSAEIILEQWRQGTFNPG